MKRKLCLALDVSTMEEVRDLVSVTQDYVGVYKVGLELFTSVGPDVVRAIKANTDAKVFLDLKLHDIPTTMERAVRSAVRLKADFLTLHAAAGGEALTRCREVAHPDTRLKLLAVTVLTSDDGPDCLHRISSYVARATLSGIDSFVCSAKDVAFVRDVAPNAFTVTPGIRPAGTDRGDQKRVTTPAEAIKAGSDLLVVGRAIRDAKDPGEAALAILREMEEAAGLEGGLI